MKPSDVADADLDDRHHRPEVNETAQRQLDLAELRHLRGLGRRAVASGGIHGEDDAANVDGGGDGRHEHDEQRREDQGTVLLQAD